MTIIAGESPVATISGSRPDITGSALIRSEGIKYTVDLGCGDFEVARRIPSPELSYEHASLA